MVVKCPNCGQLVRGEPGSIGPCPKCNSWIRFPSANRSGKIEHEDELRKEIEKTGEQPGCLPVIMFFVFLLCAFVIIWNLGAFILNISDGIESISYHLQWDGPSYYIGYVFWIVLLIISFVVAFRPNKKIENVNRKRYSDLASWIFSAGCENATLLICSPIVSFINERERIMYFFDFSKSTASPQKEIRFSDIIGVDLLQNNSKSVSLGGALVGGAIAGSAGAIVGSNMGGNSSDIKLVFYLKDIQDPSYILTLIDVPVNTTDKQYKTAMEFAQHIIGVVKNILNV